MRNFVTTEDWSREELTNLLVHARGFRRAPRGAMFAGRAAGIVSMMDTARTRFGRNDLHLAASQLGGAAMVAAGPPERGSVLFELRDGAVMDGEAELHLRDAVRALSQQYDVLAIDAPVDPTVPAPARPDELVTTFVRHSDVPVITLEHVSAPCQELALMMALHDRYGVGDGRTFLLTWTPAPRPQSPAIANSALIAAAKFGFHVRVLIPDHRFQLDRHMMDVATDEADANMRSVSVTTDVDTAYEGVDAVYAVNWTAPDFYGKWNEENNVRRKSGVDRFIVDEAKMRLTNSALVSRPLPFRRNVEISDEIANSERFIAYEEAENRIHVLKALITSSVGRSSG